jgi:hypothetical protein
LNQELDDILAASAGGTRQSGPSIAIRKIHIGTSRKKLVDPWSVIRQGRHYQVFQVPFLRRYMWEFDLALLQSG